MIFIFKTYGFDTTNVGCDQQYKSRCLGVTELVLHEIFSLNGFQDKMAIWNAKSKTVMR
jgi:hypothetical protein